MKRLVVIGCLMVIMLASSWALFHHSFFRVHDYIHAARIVEMTHALEEGHFPVRWTRNFGYGYGMPLFEFYAPLPFYFGSLLYWLGLPIIPTVKAVFLLASVLTAIGAYKLSSLLFGRMAGILSAAALTLAPYRAVNLYVRGAVSEAWGIMAMPWILLGVIKVVRGQKHGWLVLVASLTTLMLSHNIMTMIFVPFSIVFGALYLFWYISQHRAENFWKKLGILIGTYALSVGLSSFYTFPALMENKYTQVSEVLSGYFHYSQHFLYIRQFFNDAWGFTGSVWGPEDGISFFLGWGQLLSLLVLAGLLAFRLVLQLRKKGMHSLFSDRLLVMGSLSLLLLGSSLYMTLFKSLPIWNAIPALTFVQFPWRFLGSAAVFIGLLTGMSVSLVPQKYQKVWFVVLLLLLLTNARYFRPEKFLDNPDDFYYTDADRIQRQMSSILPDYIPATLSKNLKVPQTRVTCGDFEHTLDETCGGHLEVLVDNGHEVLIKTNFHEELRRINIAVADFPGWQAELDGGPVKKQVSEWGTLAVEVPRGEHIAGVYWGSTPVRFWSDMTSLMSLVVVLLLVLSVEKQSHLKRKHEY